MMTPVSPAASPASGFAFAKPAAPSAAERAFNDYAKMTPAQKMRAAILNSMGLTEDQLKEMDPKKREEVEAKVREIMKHKIEEAVAKKDKTGLLVDLKA